MLNGEQQRRNPRPPQSHADANLLQRSPGSPAKVLCWPAYPFVVEQGLWKQLSGHSRRAKKGRCTGGKGEVCGKAGVRAACPCKFLRRQRMRPCLRGRGGVGAGVSGFPFGAFFGTLANGVCVLTATSREGGRGDSSQPGGQVRSVSQSGYLGEGSLKRALSRRAFVEGRCD